MRRGRRIRRPGGRVRMRKALISGGMRGCGVDWLLRWGRPHPNPPPEGEGIILLGEGDGRTGGLPVLFLVLFWGKGEWELALGGGSFRFWGFIWGKGAAALRQAQDEGLRNAEGYAPSVGRWRFLFRGGGGRRFWLVRCLVRIALAGGRLLGPGLRGRRWG